MSPDNVCPFCGAPLDNNVGSLCPSCGSALPVRPTSAPTLIAQKPVFNSSAEAMDEVKRLINEGDPKAAAEIAGTEFGLTEEAAKSTVEQVEVDMQHSGKEPVFSLEPAPSPDQPKVEVVNTPYTPEPEKPSNSRRWIIGGSIAAVVFLCICCCLPLLLMVYNLRNSQ